MWILYLFIALVVLLIILKLLKFSLKTIIKIAINTLIGLVVVYLLNLIPSVDIPLEWWSGLIVGVFGIPGAIVLLIISFII